MFVDGVEDIMLSLIDSSSTYSLRYFDPYEQCFWNSLWPTGRRKVLPLLVSVRYLATSAAVDKEMVMTSLAKAFIP